MVGRDTQRHLYITRKLSNLKKNDTKYCMAGIFSVDAIYMVNDLIGGTPPLDLLVFGHITSVSLVNKLFYQCF
jgi:hypothetical protein